MKQLVNKGVSFLFLLLFGVMTLSVNFGILNAQNLKEPWTIKFHIKELNMIRGDDGRLSNVDIDFDPYAKMGIYGVTAISGNFNRSYKEGEWDNFGRQTNRDYQSVFHTPVWKNGLDGVRGPYYARRERTPRGWGTNLTLDGSKYGRATISFGIYDEDDWGDDQFDVNPGRNSLVPTLIVDRTNNDILLVQKNGAPRRVGTVGRSFVLEGDGSDFRKFDELQMAAVIQIDIERGGPPVILNLPDNLGHNHNRHAGIYRVTGSYDVRPSVEKLILKHNGDLEVYGRKGGRTEKLYTVKYVTIGAKKYKVTHSSRLSNTTIIMDFSRSSNPYVDYEKVYKRRGRASKERKWRFRKSSY